MDLSFLDRRPIIVAIAGSNGAGKSTFYHAHFAETDLRSINADDLAAELKIDPYEAAEVATALREALLVRRESFLFETVFSDPVGDKVDFLCRAVAAGYEVALLFVIEDVLPRERKIEILRSLHDKSFGRPLPCGSYLV